MSTIHIFVSYSHRDDCWLKDGANGLIPWLAQQLKRNEVEIWYDHALRQLPGAEYKKLIQSEIDRAHLAILLISQDFVNSDFIQEFELPWIHERVDRSELSLIPILVGSTLDEDLGWLADRQMLPGKPAPLIDYTESPAKWQAVRLQILGAIRDRCREIVARRPPKPAPAPAPARAIDPECPPSGITAVHGASSAPAVEQAPQPPPIHIAAPVAPTESDRATEKGLPGAERLASQRAHSTDHRQPQHAHAPTKPHDCARPAGGLSMVRTPAICLLTVGAIYFLMFLVAFATTLAQPGKYDYSTVVIVGVWACISLVIFLGGMKMLQLSSYRMAMAGAIAASIPFLACFSIPTIPIGVWCLLMLNKTSVKSAFPSGKSRPESPGAQGTSSGTITAEATEQADFTTP